eukprot:gnl/MRDRNA2_/MRDRNA2_20408_c0_seq1.p1 gnl/MRDRNA2_/MRDRNA2_20408_c0~~gnl/MRDRNA2_/MRDRNA2_20408_c0_seq1.p1  ORF type:complete len:413 (+),score=125.66 gnl/MRDRNA2_/MRDRNA2_20408_c0_seq1:61-1299(+)
MEKRFAKVDYYAVLEVKPSASDSEIKTAFRRLALKHHPDKANYDKAQATEKFQAIAEAYEVLSDEALRAKYIKARSVRPTPGSADSQKPPRRSADCSHRPWWETGEAPPEEFNAPRKETGAPRKFMSVARMAGARARQQRDQRLAEQEQEWKNYTGKQKDVYDELKGAVKKKLIQEGDADVDWDNWLKDHLNRKWLNDAWEEHLPGRAFSSKQKDGLLGDVLADLAAGENAPKAEPKEQMQYDSRIVIPQLQGSKPGARNSQPAGGYRQQETSEAQSGARSSQPSGGGGYPKQSSQCASVNSAAGSASKPDDIQASLQSMGFADGDIAEALRRHSTLESATAWLLEGGGKSQGIFKNAIPPSTNLQDAGQGDNGDRAEMETALKSMGFSARDVQEALRRFSSLEAATAWLCK